MNSRIRKSGDFLLFYPSSHVEITSNRTEVTTSVKGKDLNGVTPVLQELYDLFLFIDLQIEIEDTVMKE